MTAENLDKTSVGLLHKPLGNAHPYKQEPYERIPRHPQVGDSIKLGVSTWPPQAIDRVWAEWEVDEVVKKTMAEGSQTGSDDGQAYWVVELPAMDRRARVAYKIFAVKGDQTLHSEEFAFFSSGWISVGQVLDAWTNENTVRIECELKGSKLQAAFTFIFSDPDVLKLETIVDTGPFTRKETGFEKIDTEEITFEHHGLELHVERNPVRFSVLRSGEPFLSEIEPMEILVGGDDKPLKLRRQYQSPEDEAFYGFGERYNALNQRGETLDVLVYEQYKDQGKRTYYPVPFSLSSRGYALYLDTAQFVGYDLAASRVDCWSYCADLNPDGRLDTYLYTDPDPLNQIARFAELTGKPELPPRWVFGLWMSSNEWNSQEEVLRQARLTKEHEIPASVLVIEAWSDEVTFYIWNDAQYSLKPGDQNFTYSDFTFPSEGLWPDPKAMIGSLHDDGLRLVLWQIPAHKTLEIPHPQQDLDRATMVDKGYAVLESTGEPYRIRPFWFRDGLLWDVTNPEAVEWWLSKRTYLLDELGVDGFKTDGGEHLWGFDLKAFAAAGANLVNRYPLLYIKAYHDFAKEHREGEAITFSRAGFTGAGAFPAHWAGDENSTWEAFRASVLAGLNIGMVGAPFWGWDIAGFSGEIPTAELYLRSTAMAVFCPILQYHSEFNDHQKPNIDRTPWNIQERTGNEAVIPTFRMFANLRMNLLPLILHEAKHSSDSGMPMMRALPLVYPADQSARAYPYEYLFGEDLLVSPVMEEGVEKWKTYLPDGRWFDLWSGDVHDGPALIEANVPLDRIPVFVRAGAILPLNLGPNYSLGEPVGNDVDQYQNLSLLIHGFEDASLNWYDSVSGETHRFEVVQDEECTMVRIPQIPFSVTLIIRGQRPAEVIAAGLSIQEVDDLKDLELSSWYALGDHQAVIRLPVTGGSQEIELHLAR